MNSYFHQVGGLAVHNKYTQTYLSLCLKANGRAATRQLAKDITNDPIEAHHVLPRSFSLGGEKDKDNLVYLTLREHFIAHLLLTRMFKGPHHYHMLAAFGMMCASGRFHEFSNNRAYSNLRMEFYKRRKETPSKSGKLRKGTPHTEEWKRAASERAKQQMSDPAQIELRKLKSKELATTPETIERSRQAAKLQMSDPKFKAAVSAAQRGKIHVYNPATMIEKVIAPERFNEYEILGYVLGAVPGKSKPKK